MDSIIDKAAMFLDVGPEFIPKDMRLLELTRRILWFLVLRLLMALTLIVIGFGKASFFPHLYASAETFYFIAIILIVLDFIYWVHYRRVSLCVKNYSRYSVRIYGNIHTQIILDYVILTYLVYVLGGIESPAIFFYLFHVGLSCLFFKRTVSFIYTVISILLACGVCLLLYNGILPETHFMKDPAGHWEGSVNVYYYLAGVCAVYFICWYLVSTITKSLRHSEKALQAKIEELVEMDREKTRYMLTTTHELKAPFTAIQSYINVLLEGYVGQINEKVREILERMKTRCQRLLTMINDMLQLANIKSVLERGAELEPVDASQVIRKVIETFSAIAERQGIKISTFGMGHGQFWIMGLKDKLEILFANVLSNAIHYSRPDSEVLITFDKCGDKRLVVIEDYGVGIKVENLSKVFLEHFRSERTVGMNKNSTGLGLTICKNIIDLHKGKIWIESVENRGTKVFMEFDKSQTHQ